jgi:aryl-alcohol dehydrogenase-like predicted oxidoreductase
LVQLPLNVLDQRFIVSGRLALLKRRRVEVHARSIFLQGVLLMEPGALPRFFAPLRETLDDYANALSAHRMSRVDGALAFIRQADAVDCAIVGVQSVKELGELVAASNASARTPIDFGRFAVADEDLILPPRWKL